MSKFKRILNWFESVNGDARCEHGLKHYVIRGAKRLSGRVLLSNPEYRACKNVLLAICHMYIDVAVACEEL